MLFRRVLLTIITIIVVSVGGAFIALYFSDYYIDIVFNNKEVVKINPDKDKIIFSTDLFTILLGNSIQSVSSRDEVKIPILMYHRIRNYDNADDPVGIGLSVSPEKFEDQLKWLDENNYQTVNFNVFTDSVIPDSKLMILTFDDGYSDAYTQAFPLLKKYGFIATFYIITKFIDENDDYLTWDQIIEMQNQGMNIGSHTISHPNLDKASDEELEKQIGDSKKIIEEKIKSEIFDFCYPAGKYNERVIDKLKNYGYRSATTVNREISNLSSNLFELPRIRMGNSTNLKYTLEK